MWKIVWRGNAKHVSGAWADKNKVPSKSILGFSIGFPEYYEGCIFLASLSVIVRGLLVDNLPIPRDFMRQVFLFEYHMVPLDEKVCTKKLQVKELLPLKGY